MVSTARTTTSTSTSPVTRFVVVPAAYVFLLRPGPAAATRPTEVLLQLRQNTGYMDGHWAAAAAGHLERGETAYDAARREAVEELAIAEVGLEFVTAMQRTRHDDPIDERIDFFFTATTWSGIPTITEPHKCAELRWWPLESLPPELVSYERVVLDGVRDGGLPAYTQHGF
jgi:8-oxo-dGTP diphosphatase